MGGACAAALTRTQYQQLLTAAGFTAITIAATHDAGDGRILRSSRQPGLGSAQVSASAIGVSRPVSSAFRLDASVSP
jgi:hypothetical protein